MEEANRPLHFVVTCECPVCGKQVVLRETRHGSRFFGCLGYPDCRHTQPYDDLIDTLTTLVRELTEKLIVYERRSKLRIVRTPPEEPHEESNGQDAS